LCWIGYDGCVVEDNTKVQHKKVPFRLFANSYLFYFALTDDILKCIPTKGSTHLLEKPTILVVADAEMKNIPFMYVDVLCVDL
jgi:hypothetical protein